MAAEPLRNTQRGLGARDIQRHNDFFFCRHAFILLEQGRKLNWILAASHTCVA